MKRIVVLALLITLVSSQVSKYVDHFIGTDGEGFGYWVSPENTIDLQNRVGGSPPGAQVPFGAVRLSPDTVYFGTIFIPWNHNGGYYYGDPEIRVFSHTHMVGSGDLGT